MAEFLVGAIGQHNVRTDRGPENESRFIPAARPLGKRNVDVSLFGPWWTASKQPSLGKRLTHPISDHQMVDHADVD